MQSAIIPYLNKQDPDFNSRFFKQEIEHSQKIFESAPIGMVISDLNGILLKANDSFCQTIGYKVEEIIGLSFSHFTHPDDLELNLKMNSKVRTGEIQSHQMEKRYIKKDGEILNAIMKVTTLGNNSSSRRFLLAQILDISERVNLFKEKEQSEKEFREIFEEAAIGMIHTNADLDIIRANKAACALLEYPCKELTGRYLGEFSLKNDIKVLKKKGSAFTRISREVRYITKSGKVLYTILKLSYLKNEEILCQITDISSLKEYENLLKGKYNELQKVNTELDSFIYRSSHDLKGPLATLKGLTQLQELQSLDPKILKGFSFSIQKLETVIRELVEFSENSQNIVDNQEIDIEKLIEDSIEVYHHHPTYPKIRFIKEIRNIKGFKGDVRRLKPILNNLIINAIDYSDLNKTEPYVKISVQFRRGHSELVIQDNGIGMQRSVKKRAFEMFYRGTERSTGSGLGLYLVKELVTKLNGTVSLRSNPGKGSTLLVKLPVDV